MLAIARHAASFRDPAGFVFEDGNRLFRAVHPDALEEVELLFSSGLHDELVASGQLVAHVRIDPEVSLFPSGWGLFEPDRLEAITYASEWTDAQFVAAAILTLDVQRRALAYGLTLKDASAFNVQFVGSRPVFIDLLSFTRLGNHRAWSAYRQYCEHFIAPLAVRRYLPDALMYSVGLAGIPLPAASKLLPSRTWLSPSIALHIHLHARAARAGEGRSRSVQPVAEAQAVVDFQMQLTVSLRAAIAAMTPQPQDSAWADYRKNNVYSSESAQRKLDFVKRIARDCLARRALDLGANDGHYARALVDVGVACTAVEIDRECAERIYASSTTASYETHLNTMRMDLTNPTPAHGWAHGERASFVERMRCDLVLALALVHHLSITHQVPFDKIAEFLAALAPHAIVEYVPADDAMSRQLLAARTGMRDAYIQTLSQSSFEAAFVPLFECRVRSEPLDSGRTLYHFVRRS